MLVSAFRVRLGSRIAAAPARRLAYNIFDEEPKAQLAHADHGDTKKIAEQIFIQHAAANVLTPGAAFGAACKSLSLEYNEKLSALTNPAMKGRAFQLFDANDDRVISLEEFVGGVAELVEPSTPQCQALLERLKAGQTTVASKDFTHVKRVAILGAGVAGLQVADLLKKISIKCTIFEKTDDVASVWRKKYQLLWTPGA